jgi:cytosine/adenosine deaminase-related metal-dependent hydrolase
MKILAAKYVLPISRAPIEDGAVAIDGSIIKAAGTKVEITARYPGAAVEDLGHAAIMPGFVNCHSHLEVTALRGALDSVEHDFSAWLLRLNSIRQGLSDEDIRLSALAGAAEGAAAGVTCFGDIGRFAAAGSEALKTIGLRGIVFQETEFGVEDSTADDDMAKLKDKFQELKAGETHLVTVGLSPHSPYTVGPRQLKLIRDFAQANDVNLTIHASESMDEEDLLQRGTGFFPEMYKRFNVQWQTPLCSTIEYLDRLGILETRPLLAHCVTISQTDIELIARSGSAIAHCPVSNAKFGHGYAPLESFLDAGITVGLGSDSVASNNACDLLAESRFAALAARNRPGSRRFTSAQDVLKAATLGGARALGLEDAIGTLEAGKQADIAAVSLTHLAQAPVTDIYAALVFSSNARDVVRTIVAGKDVFMDGKVVNCDEAAIKSGLGQMMRSGS